MLEGDDGNGVLLSGLNFEVLEACLETGCVQAADGRVRVTPAGQACFKALSVLHQPTRIAAIREGVALSEYTVWELVLFLDSLNFIHAVKKAARKEEEAVAPFDPIDPDSKIWYSEPGSKSVHRTYLLLLAMGQHTVPHFQIKDFYEAILEGKPCQPREKRGT